MTRKAVPVYVRIADNDEIEIGTARTISDVPALLYLLADSLRTGMSADALEPASEGAPRPS